MQSFTVEKPRSNWRALQLCGAGPGRYKETLVPVGKRATGRKTGAPTVPMSVSQRETFPT